MNDLRFARKTTADSSLSAPAQKGLEYCLLRVLFDVEDNGDKDALRAAGVRFEGPAYEVKELAADLGLSKFSIYPMLSEDRPISFSRTLRVLDFIHFKNPDDTRLLDFICAGSGYLPMPKSEGMEARKVRAILMAAHDLTKGDPE